VVLDEIHAYEPYTLGLLLEALEREPPARLALASATLPEPLLALFPRGTLVEAEPSLWQRKRHRVELREGSLLEDGAEEALRYACEGKRVLVIANTIRDAQALYQKLAETGWENLTLLHSRFTLRDRMQKEERVSQAEPGAIFIATQVVEVSLDISYEVLITEIAPVDALVQRMGRVNRQGEHAPAPVLIYTQWSEGTQSVYGKELLAWSLEILAQLPPTPTDRDLAEATHQLYERVVPTEEWQHELAEGRTTLDELQRILGCYTIDLSDEVLCERFTARRGMVTVEVLPAQFVEEAYRLKEQGELWRLPELLVPVPIWWFRESAGCFDSDSDLRVIRADLPYTEALGAAVPARIEGSAAILE
jgi:CRISPR-associated endonuclease/helicase Cas3